jgi:hypothetical protein
VGATSSAGVSLSALVHRHRRTIMEGEARAQREGPGQLVVAGGPGIDHLRFRVEVYIAGEQRVVDHQAVNAGDSLRRPEGVERAYIGVHHGAQNFILRQRRT